MIRHSSRRLLRLCDPNSPQNILRRHIASSNTPSPGLVSLLHARAAHRSSLTLCSAPPSQNSSTLMGGMGAGCNASSISRHHSTMIANTITDPIPHAQLMSTLTTRRNLTSGKKKLKAVPEPTNTVDSTLKSLRELHTYVKDHLSLDIWTVNIILLTFIVGPAVWNSMKTSSSTHNIDEIPVDDPVEHSVRILLESTRKLDDDEEKESKTTSTVTIISPEEDARRLLNDLLASDNVKNKASKVASGVIQSPPFQNACKVLVRNIWDDLINHPETKSQLSMLVYTVLQNEKVYAAVKDLVLQLVNDEEVYKELTELVVKLGEEKEVLSATQQLLTESAHRTLNDPNVLDHSMEFATEVVGDDVVQRTGGEALRNTVGYAVQPSGGAVLAGLGTMIVAGCLHFYFSRRGGGDSTPRGGDSFSSFGRDAPNITVVTHAQSSPQSLVSPMNRSVSGGSFGGIPPDGNHPAASLLTRLFEIAQSILGLPSALVGSVRSSITSAIAIPAAVSDKCSSGWAWLCGWLTDIFSIPSQIGASLSATLSSNLASASQFIAANVGHASAYLKDSWLAVLEFLQRATGNNPDESTL
ncbi:hypothetical protein ACHAXT_010396 [Thalassiosira profunda]